MTPDDPRHGTPAGYLTHYRENGGNPCEPCRVARNRARKLLRLQTSRGVPMLHTGDELAAVLGPWLAMGLRVGDVARAAGWAPGQSAHLHHSLREGLPVRRTTFRRLAGVRECDLDDQAMVYADLTRTRVYSLMAAGHSLRDIPIPETGRWRGTRFVAVGTARPVREFFAANEARMGRNLGTATRARAAGHVPPLGWDDPGTLAWPDGAPSTEPAPCVSVDAADPVVVRRILDGDWRLTANHAERGEVLTQWRDAGRSLADLERLTGWNTSRIVTALAAATDTPEAA